MNASQVGTVTAATKAGSSLSLAPCTQAHTLVNSALVARTSDPLMVAGELLI